MLTFTLKEKRGHAGSSNTRSDGSRRHLPFLKSNPFQPTARIALSDRRVGTGREPAFIAGAVSVRSERIHFDGHVSAVNSCVEQIHMSN